MSESNEVSTELQDFILKALKEAMESQNTSLHKALGDISSRLNNVRIEKEEENFKEYRDVLLEISLRDFDYITPTTHIEQINSSIRKWIGTLFDKLSKASFAGYFQDQLSEEETKVFFSRNLIINFINFIDCFQSKTAYNWPELSKEVIRSFEQHSKRALEFLMSKYPQKNNVQPDVVLSELIPEELEKSSNPLYDVIATSGFVFSYEESGHYESQIKTFMNIIIDETKDKRSSFVTEMKHIFTITKENSEELEEVWNVVGSKLSETTNAFTEEEILRPGIDITNSEVLRVLIKWIEYMYDNIKNVRVNIGERITGFIRKGRFLPKVNNPTKPPFVPVIDHGLSVRQKNQLMTSIESEFTSTVSEIEHDHNEKLNSLLSSLIKFISENRITFEYISSVEFKTSLFSHIVSESVSVLVVKFMSHLIHILKRAIHSVSRVDEDLKDISLIKFGIMDLLRAKCQGTRDQILKVYQNLKNNTKFEIIRVKNRLKTGNKDFLINFQYKQSFLLCQLQLYVKTPGDIDRKQPKLQHFSHFLYELERSRYGSLLEAAIVCSNLYGPVSYFRQALGELSNDQPRMPNIHDLHPEYYNGTFRSTRFINNKNDYSFICHSCYRYFNAYSTFLDVLTHQDLMENICGECILQLLGPERETQCILGDKMGPYFKRINLNYNFKDQDYVVIVNKEFSRKLRALRYYSSYKFFSPVFLDHEPHKFFEFKDLKNMEKHAYIFILNREKLTLLPDVKMETLLNKQLKQSIPIYVFLEEEASCSEFEREEKYVPILPINSGVNSLSMEEVIICFTHQGDSVLIIDSTGKVDANREYLRTKREDILQQYVKSKVDTWVGEDLLLNETHFSEVLNKSPAGIIIRRIRFHGNQFKTFKIELRDLEELNLKNNNFERLDFSEFVLEALQILDLSYNQITEVVNTRLSKMHNLLSLNLSNNLISEFPLEEGTFLSLERLILSNNPLKHFKTDSGFEFPNLNYLEIEETSITLIEFTKVKFSSLQTLMLKSNPFLESIYLPRFEKLEEIDASKSKILSKLKFDQFSIRNLKVLVLSQCSFDKFGTRYEFPDLERLEISSNRLTELDLTKSNMISLKELDASNNILTSVLEKLSLQKNRLERVDIDPNLNHLVDINLEQNLLIDLNISPSPFLKRLQLKLNVGKIESLVKFDSIELPLLEYLSIGINPKSSNYIEWVYKNLPEERKKRFQTKLAKIKLSKIKDRIRELDEGNFSPNPKETKAILRVMDKIGIHSPINYDADEIYKMVIGLFKSAHIDTDFTCFIIYPIMNILNTEYNVARILDHKSNKESTKKPFTISQRQGSSTTIIPSPYDASYNNSFNTIYPPSKKEYQSQPNNQTPSLQAYIPINISPYIINPMPMYGRHPDTPQGMQYPYIHSQYALNSKDPRQLQSQSQQIAPIQEVYIPNPVLSMPGRRMMPGEERDQSLSSLMSSTHQVPLQYHTPSLMSMEQYPEKLFSEVSPGRVPINAGQHVQYLQHPFNYHSKVANYSDPSVNMNCFRHWEP